jgi:hypothetical protein
MAAENSENINFKDQIMALSESYKKNKDIYASINKYNRSLYKSIEIRNNCRKYAPEATAIALLTIKTFFPTIKKKLDDVNEYPSYHEGEDPKEVADELVQESMEYIIDALEACAHNFLTIENEHSEKIKKYVSDVCKVIGFHYEQNFKRTEYSDKLDLSGITSILN